MSEPEVDGINRYSESSLHRALKYAVAEDGDRFEVAVDGSVIDVVRDDLLIEIQTGNFSNLKSKLNKLLKTHDVRVVHPIAMERWLVKIDGDTQSKRRSPKKGHVTHVFSQLVYLHHLMAHPRFSLQVVMIRDEEIRVNDGKGSWRRKGWRIDDRRLLEIVDIESDSLLAEIIGTRKTTVNSLHHQAVDRVGDDVRITAYSPDGIVEALEVPDRRFALTVQWHPEDMVEYSPNMRNLFKALVDSARS